MRFYIVKKGFCIKIGQNYCIAVQIIITIHLSDFFRSKIMKNLLTAFMAIGLVLFGLGVTVSVSANAEGLEDYVGNYTFKEGSPIPSTTIKIVKEKLIAAGPDGNEFELEKVKDKADTFTIAELGAEIVFSRNADKKVTGMKVSLEDGDIEATKDAPKEAGKPKF
jgi:hypothetical protein